MLLDDRNVSARSCGATSEDVGVAVGVEGWFDLKAFLVFSMKRQSRLGFVSCSISAFDDVERVTHFAYSRSRQCISLLSKAQALHFGQYRDCISFC
jgi:hypothetical protein